MILNLSELSDEPLHAQVSRQIRAKILSQDLADGEALPSIRGVQSRRGKGFWVAPIPQGRKQKMAEERFADSLKKLVAHAAADGLSQADMRRILEKLLKKGARR
jgi:DNA-binding transcriptional regulator YhcF (GntR family)